MRLTERIKLGWGAFRQGAAGGPLFPVGAAISAALRAKALGDFQTKAVPFIWPDWRGGVPQWKMFSYEGYVEEGFNLNTLIYSAIMYKVRSGRASPLRAWTGTPEERELADLNHPLSKLVMRPNKHQSWSEFQDQYITYINIAGNNYGLLDRPSPGALPTAMYNLRPDRVFVVPGMVDGRHMVIGYLYVPEGKTTFFRLNRAERLQAEADGRAMLILPDDMMHVKFPNPGDPLEGMGDGLSPISPLARSADVDNAVTHFLKLFFDHGITVPGLLSFDSPLDDPTAARIKERWKEIYGGYERWAEEIMLAGSGAKYQRIGFTFDEMGFKEIDERNESRCHGPFGVPPILTGSRLGLTRSSYGMAYEQARRAYWEDTAVPETMLFEAEYQWVLRSDDGVFVAYDFSQVPALRKNIPDLVVAIKDLFSIGMPANQAMRTVGLKTEPIPGGDIGYLPLNLLPVGTAASDEEDMEEAPDAADDTRKMLALLQGKKKPKASVSRPNSTFTNK